MSDMTFRLLSTIKAAAPAVVDISVGTAGNSATVTVSPPNQQSAAQATIDGFDWSQAAQDAWEASRNSERTGFLQGATAAFNSNVTYINLASPSNAQVAAQVKALTQQINALAKYLQKVATGAP